MEGSVCNRHLCNNVGKMMLLLIFGFTIMLQVTFGEVDLYDPEIAQQLFYANGAYREIVGRGPAFGSYYLESKDKIEIECRLPPNVTSVLCKGGDVTFEVYDEITETVVGAKNCTNDSWYNIDSDNNLHYQSYMSFYFRVNEPRLFGRLRCRYHGNGKTFLSNNTLTFPFVMCNESSQACQNSAPCDNELTGKKYCVVTKDGSKPCTTITDPSWCDMERKHSVYCPVNVMGACNSAVKNASATFFTAYEDYGCPEGPMDQSPLSYNGKTLLFKEPFNAGPPEALLRFKCPEGSPFFNATIELRLYHWGAKKANAVCVNEVNFNLSLINPELFTEGATTHSLTMRARETTSHKSLGQFENHLISFGTELEISNQFGELQCMYTSYVGYAYHITRWWTKESTGAKRFSEERFGYVYVATEKNKPWTMFRHDMSRRTNDIYQCHVLLEYKSCSPHRHFQREISSKKFQYYYSFANALQGNSQVYWTMLLLVIASLQWW